ncbi:MAG TPA: hypothetical protein VL404_05990 [Candidatus Eisenbacteria bacterium]|jgi:hypothetical protein|nr:hypothetical protein [Candidatus Eisenbacteria bacterium]
MAVFELIEWLAIVVFVWLAANILRYLFFKKPGGGILFFLSEQWIDNEKKKRKGEG